MSMMMTPLRMSISCTTGFFSCLNRSGTQFSPLYIMSAQGELGNQLHAIVYCNVGLRNIRMEKNIIITLL